MKIAVFASGNGSNFQVIAEQFPVEFVFSDHRNAYVLERAKNLNVVSHAFELKEFDNKAAYEEAIVKLLDDHQIDLVCLAGYMKIITPGFVEAYPNAIINIHPALIPSFCGAGFYGMHVHQAVIDYGVKVTGATVHFVNEVADGGPVIMQETVAVADNDTPESIQQKVLKIEHELLPQAVKAFCLDQLSVEGRLVKNCQASN